MSTSAESRMARRIFEPEHDMFRDSFRRWLEREVAPHAERWREAGQVDREAYAKAGAQGYLLMWADERYGGAGVEDFRYEQIMIEENVARGEQGFFMTLHSRLVGRYLGALGTEEQKQRFLPRLASGERLSGKTMLNQRDETMIGSHLVGSCSNGRICWKR